MTRSRGTVLGLAFGAVCVAFAAFALSTPAGRPANSDVHVMRDRPALAEAEATAGETAVGRGAPARLQAAPSEAGPAELRRFPGAPARG